MTYRIFIIEAKKADGSIKKTYNIEYLGGECNGLIEFYANDLNNPLTSIRFGYSKHPDSL